MLKETMLTTELAQAKNRIAKLDLLARQLNDQLMECLATCEMYRVRCNFLYTEGRQTIEARDKRIMELELEVAQLREQDIARGKMP